MIIYNIWMNEVNDCIKSRTHGHQQMLCLPPWDALIGFSAVTFSFCLFVGPTAVTFAFINWKAALMDWDQMKILATKEYPISLHTTWVSFAICFESLFNSNVKQCAITFGTFGQIWAKSTALNFWIHSATYGTGGSFLWQATHALYFSSKLCRLF